MFSVRYCLENRNSFFKILLRPSPASCLSQITLPHSILPHLSYIESYVCFVGQGSEMQAKNEMHSGLFKRPNNEQIEWKETRVY